MVKCEVSARRCVRFQTPNQSRSNAGSECILTFGLGRGKTEGDAARTGAGTSFPTSGGPGRALGAEASSSFIGWHSLATPESGVEGLPGRSGCPPSSRAAAAELEKCMAVIVFVAVEAVGGVGCSTVSVLTSSKAPLARGG